MNPDHLIQNALLGFIVAWLILQPCNCHALEPDKAAHLGLSYSAASTATTYLEDTRHPIIYGFAAGMVPGLVKRVADNRGTFDPAEKRRDMIANVVGALAGSVISHRVFVDVEERRRLIGVRFTF